jgi:hypothetical protein
MDAGIMSGTYPGICRANVYVHTNAICRLLCGLIGTRKQLTQ